MNTKYLTMFLMGAILLTACLGPVPQTETVQDASASSQSQQGQPAVDTSIPSQQVSAQPVSSGLTYPIVDTGQGKCYDARAEMTCSASSFSGQDAQYTSNIPSFTLSADGLTVSDNVTGLVWQRSPDTNADGILNKSDKLTLEQAQLFPAALNATSFGGYTDWRLPTIKELYSLIDFRGTDPSGASGMQALIPFLDTNYFQFAYGDSAAGERTIDSQYASSTTYVGGSVQGGQKLFGVNFADGRIKGYDLTMPGGSEKTFFVLAVRGNTQYGINAFADNGDGSITDNATGLTWAKDDSGAGMNWEEALAYVQAQNAANYLGHNDWRLPDIKELQSIIDYSRSPDTTNSASIDPLFNSTQITNEAGQADYPFYWTSTTHAGSNGGGETADYLAFGRALGYMNGNWVDVHGAGAQRSDPKIGDASQFPQGRGPQGDAIRIDNYVRLVRGGNVVSTPNGNPTATLPSITTSVTSTDMNLGGALQNGQNQLGGPQGGGVDLAGGGSQQPPQEAINACAGLSQGAACTMNTPNGTVSGTCGTPPNQSVVACMPAGTGPRP